MLKLPFWLFPFASFLPSRAPRRFRVNVNRWLGENFFLNYLFIYLFLALLGLRFCARAFSSCGERGPLSSRYAGLSLSRPLLLRRTGSRRAGSVAVAHGPSWSAACGILPDQGSNPCPLHWQADSQPLRHQGSPRNFLKFIYFILFLAALGLRCCAQAFSSCRERGLLFVAVHGPLIAVASLVAELRL